MVKNTAVKINAPNDISFKKAIKGNKVHCILSANLYYMLLTQLVY